jgi:glutathione S-transferase
LQFGDNAIRRVGNADRIGDTVRKPFCAATCAAERTMDYPLAGLATVFAIAVYVWTMMVVGKARATYKIAAPSMTGDLEFEKRVRVQMNTLEQLAILVPALWLCAFWVGDVAAGIGGAVWTGARVLYATSYYADPKKRGPGFGIAFFAAVGMLAASLVQIVRDLLF